MILDEIRTMSEAERAEVARLLLGGDPVPEEHQNLAPIPVDEFGRKLSLAEQYDRDHPLLLRDARYPKEVHQDANGKRVIVKWEPGELEEYNQRLTAEHEKAKAEWLAERGCKDAQWTA